ncbi:MAG: tol-pal system protein YbgF [Pseudomonadota bacterium]|nr:tol-pal system protein YbgF [Pseudomonadota bacterium]
MTLNASPFPAWAQNTDSQDRSNRLERFQRELSDLELRFKSPPPSKWLKSFQRQLSDLQNRFYKGLPPKTVPRKPAAAEAMATVSRKSARNSTRIAQLEAKLTQLTVRMARSSADNLTRVDQLDKRLTQLTEREEDTENHLKKIRIRLNKIKVRFNKLVSGIDQRLSEIDQRLSEVDGALRNASSATPPNTIRQPPMPNASVDSTDSSAPRARENVPVMPPNNLVKVSKPVLPPGTPRSQYDYAVSLLLTERDYKKADAALKAFIEMYPQNKLTSNAHYWLAEIFYVRTEYVKAGLAFAEGFEKFPNGNKAPDSLLKLGMSLGRQEKRKEACLAFQKLQKKFPEASVRMKARLGRELRRARCR